MAYERIKKLAFRQKRRSFEKAGKPYTMEDDKLVGFRVFLQSLRAPSRRLTPLTFGSGKHYVYNGFWCQQNFRVGCNLSIPSHPSPDSSAYIISALLLQTLKSNAESPSRSHKQNNATAHLYPNIPICIKRTYSESGLRGFYRGLGTNLVRVLPGTCVTFVVYENIAWLLRRAAARREALE